MAKKTICVEGENVPLAELASWSTLWDRLKGKPGRGFSFAKDKSMLEFVDEQMEGMYDLDNVLDELYDVDNVLDKLYDLDNVLAELYDLDNVLDKLYDLDNVLEELYDLDNVPDNH